MKLFKIIEKNFKIFIRSKVSALIIFLGPLLLVSLIGMSFSNSHLPGLSVGLYSPNYNEFTNSIISKIEQNNFAIKKFNSSEVCSDAVKRGDSNICLLFPKDMSSTNNEVTFVVDYSKINLVWIVIDIFSTKVSERATELRQNYATDIIKKVVQTTDDLKKQELAIGELGIKQNDAKDAASSALADLNDIIPETSFAEQVSSEEVKSSLSSLTNLITSAGSKVSLAKSAVLGAAMADEDKVSILEKLTSAESTITSSYLYLKGNSSTKSLEFMLNDLQDALSSAKAQLQQIKDKKSMIGGDISILQQKVSDSITSIDSLSTSIKDMITRIESIKSSDSDLLVSPIRTKIEPVTTQETHFNYLFPTLIVLVIMITGILLSSTLVMNEKKSRSFFRNFITPTSDSEFNLGIFLTAFIAIVGQLLIFLFISYLFFNTEILGSFFQSLLLLLLITSVFILIGMIIGYLFKSEETYVLASITISALLLFLSSTIMPIESISNSVRQFVSVTPFVISETALRQVMFFHFDLGAIWPQISILFGYAILFVGVLFCIERLMRHKLSIRLIKKEKKN